MSVRRAAVLGVVRGAWCVCELKLARVGRVLTRGPTPAAAVTFGGAVDLW